MERRNTHQSGFTLIELMVTLAVAAVLVSVALPAFDVMVENNRRVTATNDFLTSLHQARSEAITRNRRITLCPTSDETSCSTSVGWETGWLVFVDVDGDNTVDADDEILGTTDGFSGGLKLQSSDFGDGLTYMPNGRLVDNAQGVLHLCDVDATTASRTIRINRTGRPRVSDGGGISCT